MNISYKWLKDYVDFDLTPQEVCDALTSLGLEVDALEEVQCIEGGLKGLYVGEVLTCERHPGSDHLHVTTVSLGKGAPSQIVCGAPNVAAGQKVIVADIGCVLHGGDRPFTIKKSRLRGVESCGMICAEDEIGIGTDHAGIMVLPQDAPVGCPAADYFHLESDWLIEIDITANRADALSHYGVARDLYAWLRRNGHETSLHRPGCEGFKVDNHDLPVEVTIANKEACKRYACVSVTGCDVRESPKWMQDRLRTIGIRPINNIVDITNYVMMAYGQPLHCFDADMVTGHHIVVKAMPEGTPFVTLDGVEHRLGGSDLAICDEREPMCIAGVFGGRGSGTYDTTRNVILESACFHPTWIRKSARRHGLSTDSSFRFERGVDPNGTVYALKQAAMLCREIAGGKVSMEIRDVYPEPIDGFHVSLRYDYLDSLVGKAIDRGIVRDIAESLEMAIDGETGEGLELMVPAYRVDVQRPCDVAEDILRVYGYNNVEIPGQLKSSIVTKGNEDSSHKLANLVGEQLVGAGFNEIMNNSLTRGAYYDGLVAHDAGSLVRIMNPLSSDLNVMRQTLLFGGLESIAYNANRKNPNLRLFEMGNVYSVDPGRKGPGDPIQAYREHASLALWVTGKRVEGSWAHPDEESTFFEVKAHVENILSRVGVPVDSLACGPGNDDMFSKSMAISTRGGKPLAQMGIVAARLARDAGIGSDVYYAEIDWTALMGLARKSEVSYREIGKYPSVSRDLALLLDKGVEFASVRDTALKAERKILKSVELFDVYEGKGLPAGKKSYAINLILQDEGKTLTDRQIDQAMKRIVESLKGGLDAELR